MSAPFRILVTGSRNWPAGQARAVAGHVAVEVAWAEAAGRTPVVVHGACRSGVDAYAAAWAAANGVQVEAWPADWRRAGRRAGPERNQRMVDAGADVCLAFPIDGSVGTFDCARRARAANIPVTFTTITTGEAGL